MNIQHRIFDIKLLLGKIGKGAYMGRDQRRLVTSSNYYQRHILFMSVHIVNYDLQTIWPGDEATDTAD